MDSPTAATLPSLAGFRLEARRRFRSFDTDVEIVLADWAEAWRLPPIEAFFRDFEARFSRFLPTSELSCLNARREATAVASPALIEILKACQHFFRLTEGVFNPLILDRLEAAGYDRSFEQVAAGRASALAAPAATPSFAAVRLDPAAGTVAAPLGLRIDLGGIGKGYAVDAAARLVDSDGGFFIDAGGDIYAAGRDPAGRPWPVDVVDPRDPTVALARLQLSDQAVATSWTVKRRWRVGNGWANHLIDARTGRSVESGVIAATVVAARAVEADVFAKTALILGPAAGVEFLRSHGVAGLLVEADGTLTTTPDWPGEPIEPTRRTEES